MYKKKLLDLGVASNQKGFEYLNYILTIYNSINSNMETYYVATGEKFGVTPTSVKRSISYLVSHVPSMDKIKVKSFISKYKIIFDDEISREKEEKERKNV